MAVLGFLKATIDHRLDAREINAGNFINYSNFFRFDVLTVPAHCLITFVSFSSLAQFQVLHAKIGTRDSPPAITHSRLPLCPSPKTNNTTTLQVSNNHGRPCTTILLTAEALLSPHDPFATELTLLASGSAWLWAQHQSSRIQPARHQCLGTTIRRARGLHGRLGGQFHAPAADAREFDAL